MKLYYLKSIRDTLRIFSAENTPRQLALGIALGVMIGLVPKGNLIAVALTMVLFSLKINLGTGLTTAFVVTMLSAHVDPLTHGVGVRMLRTPLIYDRLSSWYELPIVPWTSLNNSVVIGALAIGALLFYPVYHVSESLLQRWLPVLKRRWCKKVEMENATKERMAA